MHYMRHAHISAFSILNPYLSTKIASYETSRDPDLSVKDSRSELDSHANMVVLGRYCHVYSRTGRFAEVNPFTEQLGSLKRIPIVDAVICYDCPRTQETYMLVFKNALYIPSMNHNLIPPFVMREAGITVNDRPKIHTEDPTVDDHALLCSKNGVNIRIPLQLYGIFSYFTTRKPSPDELEGLKCIIMTPETPNWNPNSIHWSENEECYLDWKGDLIAPEHRDRLIVPEDEQVDVAQATIKERHEIDSKIDDAHRESVAVGGCVENDNTHIGDHPDADVERQELDKITPVFDPYSFAASVNDNCAEGKYKMAIGSVSASPPSGENYVLHTWKDVAFLRTSDNGTILDITDSTIGSAQARQPVGVSPEHLAKIWRIDLDEAKRTCKSNTQRLNRDVDGTSLSRNLDTNDRMIRYDRIDGYFFTDTFFIKDPKENKSLRQHTCAQVFVSDKGFVHVVLMSAERDYPKALKEFAKEIGVPEALVCDAARAQTSREVRDFCHKIGTTLRVLEQGTQFANKAELYIGLLKEAVRKDLRASDCPLVLWDYCLERRAMINNLTAKNLFQLHGHTPHQLTFGQEGDMSHLCNFGWYEWCYFRDHHNRSGFPLPKEVLGKYLCPAKDHGNKMTAFVLTANGTVVPRRSIRRLTPEELRSDVELKKQEIFTSLIRKRLGDSVRSPSRSVSTDDWTDADLQQLYDDDLEEHGEATPIHPIIDEDPQLNIGATIGTFAEEPLFDKLLHAELLLPQGEE